MLEEISTKLRWMRGGSGQKSQHQTTYWKGLARREGKLGNGHYVRLYTDMFHISEEFYNGKRLLDIGCGARGSLEWATNALERVGVDPLADEYRSIGTDSHHMRYVTSCAERMPFPTGYFDVVTSLNSLDHVDDPRLVIQESSRVTKPGGSFLLEVEIGHQPTLAEPISLWFDVLEDFAPSFEMVFHECFEMAAGHQVHDAYRNRIPFDSALGRHPGVLVAHMVRADELRKDSETSDQSE